MCGGATEPTVTASTARFRVGAREELSRRLVANRRAPPYSSGMATRPLKRGLAPLHPGVHLKHTILPALLADQGIAKPAFAERLGVSLAVLDNFVSGKSPVTPSLALRLGRVLDSRPEFWMDLQRTYDLSRAEEALRDQLAALKPIPKGKRR
jgi:addiction module HigA family antidote